LIIGILGGIGTVVNDLKKEEVYDDFQDRWSYQRSNDRSIG
jgi:hypothetical protein